MLRPKTTSKIPPSGMVASLFLMALAAVVLSGCQAGARSNPSQRGKELFVTCAECHGPTGEGNAAIGAPNIAGMNAWYIETELQKFRAGVRGAQFDDVEGMRMRPMSLSLPSDSMSMPWPVMSRACLRFGTRPSWAAIRKRAKGATRSAAVVMARPAAGMKPYKRRGWLA